LWPVRAPLPRWLRLSLLAIGLAVGAAWLHASTFDARTPAAALGGLDQLLVRAGLGIEQVSIEGHRYTGEAELFEATGAGGAVSLVRFDARVAEARIAQLPWIDTVSIRRHLPDAISVVVTERKPFAVWKLDGRHRLIDRTGHVLASIPQAKWGDLPVVAGTGAAPLTHDLFASLARHPPLASRLVTATRVSERRWSLQLDGGLVVHLPAADMDAALDRLASLDRSHGVLNAGLAVIDLRAHRIALRPASAPPGKTPPTKPATTSPARLAGADR
jgi:cell division protein FtsQ